MSEEGGQINYAGPEFQVLPAVEVREVDMADPVPESVERGDGIKSPGPEVSGVEDDMRELIESLQFAERETERINKRRN